jgi:isopenicillin N synthase-like dioxygenase
MANFENAVDAILQQGYAVFPMQEVLRTSFEQISPALSAISLEEKKSFSFPSRLDGFLPFGQEHAENNPDHPDLCERYCYFRKNRKEHEQHPASSTPFYKLIANYEQNIASLSQVMLSRIFDRLGGTMPEAPGPDSYIQICNYSPEYDAMGRNRSYLMDPHIDGQLLTFIAQTEQGLMVENRPEMKLVCFSPTEMFVMAGKLLEEATDGEIKGLRHGVIRHKSRNHRLSAIYFQNPSFDAKPYRSLRHGRSIDFLAVANDIHRSYGNPSYTA